MGKNPGCKWNESANYQHSAEMDADKNLLRLTNLPLFNRGTNDWEQKILEFQTGPNTSYIYFYANIPGVMGLSGWMMLL